MNAIRSCPAAPSVPLYEQEPLSALTGGTLRPGGLELTRELLGFCRLPPGARVLDIGCGPGHSLALMADEFALDASGLDPSAFMLDKAALRAPAATLHQGTAAALPCADAAFDAVLCECALSLTDNPQASLKEMHRVLRPGGSLLLTDIYCKHSQRPQLPPLKSCIAQALPLETITSGLHQAGFSLALLRDRSDLLKQLAGQIIFSHGSLEQFWSLFMDTTAARTTACALATAPLGYYALIADKGAFHG